MSENKLNPIVTDRELLFDYIYQANEKGLRPLLITPFLDTNKEVVVESDTILSPKGNHIVIKFDNERGMFVGIDIKAKKPKEDFIYGLELRALCTVSKIIKNG